MTKLPAKRPRVWTVDDIQRLPEFGAEVGWFYGVVRDHENPKRFRLAEILPGLGYTTPYRPWHPRTWVVFVRDMLRYQPRRGA